MVSDRRRWLAAAALGGATLAAGVLARPLRAAARTAGGPDGDCAPLLAHAPRPLTGGEAVPLCERFPDEVLLIVNTASRCGFTPQFEALETLHRRYAGRGFRVLGFPSDDFRQELADESEIAEFCRLNYGVSFPMFQKVGVRGDAAHPLFRDLAAASDGAPRWNFNKYLVDRDGRVLARYEATEQPLGERLVSAVETLL